MVFRCPNIQVHYIEAVIYLNFGTSKNNDFPFGTNGKLFLGVPILKHIRVGIPSFRTLMVRDLQVLQICFLEPGPFQQSAQPSQVTSFSQSVHSIPQAPASYSVSKSPGKYNPPGQSAFSSYSSHYAQHQQKITDPFPAYQIQRMQQPGKSTSGVSKHNFACYFSEFTPACSVEKLRARQYCNSYKYSRTSMA